MTTSRARADRDGGRVTAPYRPLDEQPATATSPPQLSTPRPPEDEPAGELTMLLGWIAHLRGSVLHKVDGLTPEQLRWKPAPGANAAGGIVQHLTHAERLWFRIVFAGENAVRVPHAEQFELAENATAESVAAFYEEECRLADAAIGGASPDDWSRGLGGRRATLRWILTHVVEETARHAGHLDLTRELIDGRRGR